MPLGSCQKMPDDRMCSVLRETVPGGSPSTATAGESGVRRVSPCEGRIEQDRVAGKDRKLRQAKRIKLARLGKCCRDARIYSRYRSGFLDILSSTSRHIRLASSSAFRGVAAAGPAAPSGPPVLL